MLSNKLNNEVEEMEKELREIEKRETLLKIILDKKREELKKQKESDRDIIEKKFTKNVLSLENVDRDVYITFDIKANYKGNINLKDFNNNMSELEKWLKEQKIYAHSASSFRNRSIQWYNMSLLEQLKNLCWEVKGDKLVGLDW